MRVKIYVKGWKGIGQVPLDEAGILLVSRVELDGMAIEYSGSAYLDLGGSGGDFLTLQIGGIHPSDFARLKERPDDCELGSTPERTGIVVSGLEIVEDTLPTGVVPDEASLLRNA